MHDFAISGRGTVLNIHRATLDVHDRWRRGRYCKEGPRPDKIRRQQGGGGMMLWATIIGNEPVGPFKVTYGVKMTAKALVIRRVR